MPWMHLPNEPATCLLCDETHAKKAMFLVDRRYVCGECAAVLGEHDPVIRPRKALSY